ncbi:hypothetical protein [Neotamlana laminarinivorans]|uniref:Lysylphosphatidylglycerol synthase-like protein n=1 Tax=Neotamlana laminarinivorans TaxID=2883124 RepID=A0A9X1I327_9FLAO|nr:hypothetical protein [Tamlana laminarinivorans]MCB4799089.1 hypothetical protein [Tamlana laminarinivorans]
MRQLPYKTKQFFFVLIKLSIVVGAFYFIYYKLTSNTSLSFGSFISFLLKKEVFTIKNLAFLLFLSCLNWFFEILKWQTLVSLVKKISFKNAIEQSLGSLTASLFTPNRVGEYGAKAMYFSRENRKKILLVNFWHNGLQMLVTTLFGVIGLLIFIKTYKPELNYNKLFITLVFATILFIIIIFALKKIKGFSFYKPKNISKNKLILGCFYAFIRYTIFSFQFYVLLKIFSININYWNALTIISSIYLLSSVIPSIFIFDVVIKGSIAVYLFSFAEISELTVLTVVSLMWIFNFVIPSILGSFYVIKFKLPEHET